LTPSQNLDNDNNQLTMFTDSFFPQEYTQFQQVNENTWFQEDGATSNKVRNLFNAINRLFADHVTSRNGEITCSARNL